MAPLGNAVRLVDGEQIDADAPEGGHEGAIAEALRGDVEQLEAAQLRVLHHACLLLAGHGRIDRRRLRASLPESIDLVLHEREQGRDHHGEAAFKEQGRHLVAEALAAAGGHDGERVPLGQHGGDDLGLAGPEFAVSEHIGKDLAGGREGARVGKRGPGRRGGGHWHAF
jgi:hypothetical protein